MSRLISLIATQLIVGVVWVSFAGGQMFGILDSDRAVIFRNGQRWISIADLPKVDPVIAPGMELGHAGFGLVSEAPNGRLVAVSVKGANHQWVAVINTDDRRIMPLKLLYGGGIKLFVWSPDGQKLAIEAFDASGLPVIFVWFQDRALTKVNLVLPQTSVGPRTATNPQWVESGESLIFESSLPDGTAQVKYKFTPQNGSLTQLSEGGQPQ